MAKVWTHQTGWREVETERQEILVGVGVYELPSGEIYVVKPNRAKTRVYAKRLVETPSNRLTEQGEYVTFDFVYECGAIYRLKLEHKMSIERAKKLMIRYGRCIVCGRRLKVAESVERGIGPVCIKYFALSARMVQQKGDW